MSSKITILLSIIIIIISATGLVLMRNDTIPQATAQERLLEVKVYELTRDIRAGDKISPSDLKPLQKSVSVEYTKDSFVIDRQESYILGQLAARDLKSGSVLRYEDIYRKEDSLALKPKKDFLAFSFPLKYREYQLLENIKDGSLVDVYFRYAKKSSEDSKIVAKSNNPTSTESGNLSKFVLMFRGRRVLGIDENTSEKPEGVAGYVSLEMRPDEIKSVYTIEDLGRFYFFPSQKKASQGVSTTDILPRDFIKELRGDEK